MRNFTLLLALGLTLAVNAKNEMYQTPGDGKIYTFADLAAIPESGVTADGNTYTITKDVELIQNSTTKTADGLKFDNNITVKMAKDVLVRVYGPTEFAVTDTATVCPTEDGVSPKGFHLYLMSATNRTISHVHFIGATISLGNPQGTIVENCTFTESNGNLVKSCVTFSAASVNNIVRNCHMVKSKFSAVSNGSNVAAGITVENNLIEYCSTEGRNYPYINLCPSGNNGGTYVRNNKIVGGKGLMAGAISLSNMLGMLGENKAVVENNEMSDCRYGIQVMGFWDAKVLNNKVHNCHYEAKAANGGSGMTVSCSSKTYVAKVYAEGNEFIGNLWGVTVIGNSRVNLGCVEANDTVEANPGNNVFALNGNCWVAPEGETTAYDPEEPYDLYNNSVHDIFAQGNVWGGTDQSAAEIEKRIFHQADSAALGEVFFIPAGTQGGVIDIVSEPTFQITAANGSVLVKGAAEGTKVTVYDINGVVVATGVAGEAILVNRRGIFVVAVGREGRTVRL